MGPAPGQPAAGSTSQANVPAPADPAPAQEAAEDDTPLETSLESIIETSVGPAQNVQPLASEGASAASAAKNKAGEVVQASTAQASTAQASTEAS